MLNRGNLTSGQDVFDLQGVSYITIQNLTITGGFNGIEIGGASTGVQLLNDLITANSDTGILLDHNTGSLAAGVNGLLVSNDIISGNGLDTPYGNYYGGNQAGVYVQLGNGGILFQNDQVFANNQVGIDFIGGYGSNGTSTIQGGAYYNQRGAYGGTGTGIYDSTGNVIENVLVYGNNGDGIYQSNNAGYTTTHSGTITGNTVFSNRDAGIEAHTALVTGNLIYNQSNASRNALELDGGSTGTGNTVFGSSYGIFVDGGSYASQNVVYDITGTGIDYGSSAPGPIVGNTVYGAGTGISGSEYYSGPVISITGNLIYQTTIAAIALSGGLYQNIVNNTIDSPIGTGITIHGGASSTTIENNIIAVGAGPAISIDPSSEAGLLSDYNLFDLTGTAAVVGQWEGVLYPTLASWYYEIGFDQHSQTGDPGFVSPAGNDGVLGFGTVTAIPKIIDNGGAGFSTTGTWAVATNGIDYAYQVFGSGPTATAAFNVTAGQTYEIAAMSNGHCARDRGADRPRRIDHDTCGLSRGEWGHRIDRTAADDGLQRHIPDLTGRFRCDRDMEIHWPHPRAGLRARRHLAAQLHRRQQHRCPLHGGRRAWHSADCWKFLPVQHDTERHHAGRNDIFSGWIFHRHRNVRRGDTQRRSERRDDRRCDVADGSGTKRRGRRQLPRQAWFHDDQLR